MKISFAKFVTAAVLGASLLIVPAVSRAADSSTNSSSASAGKISGTVTAVDTNAMTFTVDGQVYEETSSSMLTRNGKPAVLSDVAVGDPVKGTSTTGSDGKLAAGNVKFGKGAAKSTTKSTAKKSSKKKKKASSSATNSVPDSATMPDVAPTGTTPAAPAPMTPAPEPTMPNVPVPPTQGH